MARQDEASITPAPHPLVALAVSAVYVVVIGYTVALVARAVRARLAQKPQGRLGMVSGVLGRLAKRRAGR